MRSPIVRRNGRAVNKEPCLSSKRRRDGGAARLNFGVSKHWGIYATWTDCRCRRSCRMFDVGGFKAAEQAVPEFHRMLDAEHFHLKFATELQSAATRKTFSIYSWPCTESWDDQVMGAAGVGCKSQHVRHIHHVDWPYPIRRRGRLRTIRLPFAGR